MTRPLPLASAAILIGIMLLAIGRDYPMAGHDYRYFIPRLIDTAIFIKQNGWSIQWYTPSFGGGVPAFPNPQHLQFSLLQVLTQWIGPWSAVLASTALVMLAGFGACYHLLRKRLEMPHFESTLGSIFFVGNGFIFERMIVGHVGFQLFALLPLVLALLLGKRATVAALAALLGLLLAATVYHAGFQLAIYLALSAAMMIALVEAADWLRVDLRRAATIAAGAVIVALVIAGPKLFSVNAMMQQFPRAISDTYNVGLLQAFAGFGAQLFAVMLLTPLFWLTGANMMTIGGGLPIFIGMSPRMGLWELDSGLSPAVAVCLILGTVQLARSGPDWQRLTNRQRWGLVALAVLVWIGMDLSMSRGLWTTLFRNLPVLKSLHTGVRYASVFILPLSVIAVKAFHASPLASKPVGRWALWAVAVISPIAYVLLPPQAYIRNFDLTRSVALEQRVQRGENNDVTSIAAVADADGLAEGASSLQPYDPIFGYDNEDFAAEIAVGDVRQVRDGRFNMTNPVSLVFPEGMGLRRFERIAENDRANLDALRQRRQPDWPLPPAVSWLNRLAVATALACAAVSLMAIRIRR